ncbi:MAG: DUF4373 domain-containing protein [Clostridiales bacterium]|nr:DUF4373 domain-containing protein [Clostridiales bacterium]
MNYSLKYFSRPVHFTQGEELFINRYSNRPFNNRNFKLEAIGLITYLQMILHSDSDTGFYYDVSGNRFQLLASKMGITNKSLKQTLDWCFEYNLLDGNMFNKYEILTSIKMQDDYANAGLERRKQNICMDYVYQGCSFTQKYKIALQKYENAIQNSKNVQQNSGDETRQNEIDNKTIERNITTVEVQEFNSSLSNFKKLFPNKKCDVDIPFRKNTDFNLLIKAIEESPQFLKEFNNLNWKWCLDHYDEIITGKYKGYVKKDENKQNYKYRDYSNVALNKLVFDDLSSIEL